MQSYTAKEKITKGQHNIQRSPESLRSYYLPGQPQIPTHNAALTPKPNHALGQ